ncbi:arsenate reductase [Sphingomonas mesophila]|uniref:arsenate reductase n=1 Tax=Sphingomonas mesophila TaxID=2303576 RepID=UPI000E57716D|nr:arsenate reductase [Sphingomonas mesophila]
MITVHGIPNCDSVKKARAALGEHRFRDFKKEPPTAGELERWADAVGWEALLNRRGTTFRGLAESDKAGIDRAKALALMLAHPSLIKRPVVEDGSGGVTVGLPQKP